MFFGNGLRGATCGYPFDNKRNANTGTFDAWLSVENGRVGDDIGKCCHGFLYSLWFDEKMTIT